MKILAGPLKMTFVTDMFKQGLEGHDVLLFSDGGADLAFEYPDSRFDDVLQQLPTGWEPDLVIWWLPEFQTVLPGLEDCPYPTLALVSDWHVISDPLYPVLKMFDLVGTDLMGVDLLKKVPGIRAFHAPLYGFDPSLHRKLEGVEKCYDVSHVGDLNPLLHRDRVKALVRASTGVDDHAVRFFQHVYGEDYVKLLNQSRITINYTLRGEMSMRCYEAPACGSLLFCEDSNREVPGILKDREECVLYNHGNLVELLEYYLNHPEESARIAAAGYRKIQEFSNPKQGARCVEMAMSLLESGRDRTFHQMSEKERDFAYSEYCANVVHLNAPVLSWKSSREALAKWPDEPMLHNLLGCDHARLGDFADEAGVRKFHFDHAISHFRKALSLGLVVYCNLAGALLRNFQPVEALSVLQQAQENEVSFQHVTAYPRLNTPQWVLGEKDRENREQIARWRFFELLSEVEPEKAVQHLTDALAQRVDVPGSWFLRAMHRGGHDPSALDDLERACAVDPSFVVARDALRRGLLAQEREDEAVEIARDLALINERYPVAVKPKASSQSLQQKLGFFTFVKQEMQDSLVSFAKGISFRWLGPDQAFPPQVSELTGRGLEFSNTVFPIEHEATSKRLLELHRVPRMSTIAMGAVIQRAVALMPQDQCFVNVGVWHGFSFLAALQDNGSKRCVGVDNFSQFNGPEKEFNERYEAFKGEAHQFYSMDYQEYFKSLHEGCLGVYFYDGEHSYENQLLGLEVAQPYFADGCIIIVDDTNWEAPRKATLDFMSAHRGKYELLFDVKTADTRHITWWNGLMILRYKGG